MKVIVLGMRGIPDVIGGIEKHCEYLYPHLAQRGCEITVLGRKPYIGRLPYQYKGVRVIPLPCPKSKLLEAFVHTLIGVFAARRVGCDILHIHGIGPSLFAPLARFLGFTVVMTNHGPDYMRKKWNRFAKWVLKTGEAWGSRSATEIICISDSIAAEIARKFKRQGTVIPNGVSISEAPQSEDALEKYGLEKARYILAVGRFVPEKGFHDLIDAFARVQRDTDERVGLQMDSPDRGSGWKLVLVGAPDYPGRYSRELAAKAASNEKVVLTGFLTGKPLQELYSHAGLFVLPSYFEGLPIVLLEAMSYGLSCLASDIPANRNVALGDERFFKPGDAEALAAKITRFITRPLTEGEREAQVSMIAQRYDWAEIAERTLQVYRLALGS